HIKTRLGFKCLLSLIQGHRLLGSGLNHALLNTYLIAFVQQVKVSLAIHYSRVELHCNLIPLNSQRSLPDRSYCHFSLPPSLVTDRCRQRHSLRVPSVHLARRTCAQTGKIVEATIAKRHGEQEIAAMRVIARPSPSSCWLLSVRNATGLT